jgi:hypothetical protein
MTKTGLPSQLSIPSCSVGGNLPASIMIDKRTGLSTENDKSLKEDHMMRLYEFADPTKYNLPETDAADLLNQIRNTRSDDKPVNAARRSKTKADTKKATDTL